MSGVQHAVGAGLAALAVTIAGCSSGGGAKPSGTESPAATSPALGPVVPSASTAANPLNLPGVISAAEPACRLETLIGVQYLIEAKGTADATATLGSTLQLNDKDGARGVTRVILAAYSADTKAAGRAGVTDDQLLAAVVQAVKTGCATGKNPTLTKTQWLALTHLVGAEMPVVTRIRLFRPAGTPG